MRGGFCTPLLSGSASEELGFRGWPQDFPESWTIDSLVALALATGEHEDSEVNFIGERRTNMRAKKMNSWRRWSVAAAIIALTGGGAPAAVFAASASEI